MFIVPSDRADTSRVFDSSGNELAPIAIGDSFASSSGNVFTVVGFDHSQPDGRAIVRRVAPSEDETYSFHPSSLFADSIRIN